MALLSGLWPTTPAFSYRHGSVAPHPLISPSWHITDMMGNGHIALEATSECQELYCMFVYHRIKILVLRSAEMDYKICQIKLRVYTQCAGKHHGQGE